ncbi:unnamed protein product [Rhizoctonia solani]|uniref:Nephrocystin 3-like N-terminal domain-containing protein n=1 Tax=Rhizoctonia solani TaxID=456999 RepID=A0A8H2XFS3_9AGAM|nr:unnamed protein product [Rhizoctonia solani]
MQPTSSEFSLARRVCYRIAGIELNPITSIHDIGLTLWVDGKIFKSLPRITEGKVLRWGDVVINGTSDSKILLEILAYQRWPKVLRLKTKETLLSDIQKSIRLTIDFSGSIWTVTIQLLTKEESKRSREKILESLKQLDNSSVSFKSAGNIRKILSDFAFIAAKAHPSAELMILGLVDVLEGLAEQDQWDEDIRALFSNMVGMIEIVQKAEGIPKMNTLERVVEDMMALFEDTHKYISAHGSKETTAFKFRRASGTFDSVKTLSNRFDKLKSEFIIGLGIETHMRSSYDILSQLRPINPSGHDRSRMCQDGTREDVISEIMDRAQWLPIQRPLLWIRGQAGIGKSSIAASVCERLVSAQSLAACFFCKRDDDALRDPLRLINSIVHSLAQRCPEYGKLIATTLRNSVELCNSHMDQRYQGLIEKPLQELRDLNISPLVIVIDALDECGTPNSRQKLLGHLREMSRLVPWLGLIVTSRPTPEIQGFFQNTHNAAYTIPIDLQNFDASPDIYKFIEQNLGDVAKRDSWPDKSIEKLCQRADGIFIWAATATRYILNAIGPTEGRLRNALGNQKSPVSDSLDGLYTSILLSGMKDAGDDNKALVRQCMGAIFMTSTRQPLSIPNLSTLLGDNFDFWSLKRVVNNLGSVLIIDEQRGGIVRFFHPSFADYIIDPLRSEDFHVDLDQQNYYFARACLRIIQKEARFNICKLETSHLPNNQVLELAERINANISGSLRYSCLYWINHVTGSHSEELHILIQEIIMGPRLIFWIEVLSLIDRTDIALVDLPRLIRWLRLLPDKFKSNAVFVQDVHKLVSVFHDAIATSTPHLYISALALCPQKSVIIENLGHLFPRRVKFRKGGNQHWPRWLRSITHPTHAISLTIDPTGRVLATGSHDGTICLWNLMTGLLKGDTLSGHSKSVTSLQFSPDGARLVSGSVDGLVRMWGIEANRPIEGFSLSHSDVVTSVAFSADGKRIISGSWDGTIQISSAETGEPININRPFVTSHPKKLNCIAISPDGVQIAYSFESCEARVRDLQSGEEKLLVGHSGEITSIAFSRDGVYIITGSVDMTVQLWRSNSGDSIGRPLIGHSGLITAISFSPDGSKIVSSCNDSIIRVFDVKRSRLIDSPLTGHSGAVTCIAFAPDGAQIISGSLDKTLRIWEINTESKTGITPFSHFLTIVHSLMDAHPRLVMSSPLTGHTGEISAVSFSSDGLCVISGSSDGTARMWDTKTGNPICRPFKHNRVVNGLVISPDGKYLATRCGTRVCVWDVDENSSIIRPLAELFAIMTVASVLLVSNYHTSRHHANLWFENSEMGEIEERHANYLRLFIPYICSISLLVYTTRALLLGSYIPHPEEVSCICFSPDGSRLFSAARDGKIRAYDAKTFKLLGPPLRNSGPVTAIACTSRQGQIISSSSDGSVRVWDIMDRESKRIAFIEYPSSGGATVITFDPKRNVVAFGFTDNSIRLWNFDCDIGTGSPISGALIGHSDLVRSIAFSPNQRLVVSGSDDMTIRIWDLQTSSSLGGPFIGHSGPVRSVAFSPDNSQIVSGSADGTIKVWIVDPSTSTQSSDLETSDLPLESIPYESLSSPSLQITHPGWYSHDKQSLSLWLPDHYRKAYDPRALICISSNPSDTIQFDLSEFTHGENWASIATDNVRNNTS